MILNFQEWYYIPVLMFFDAFVCLCLNSIDISVTGIVYIGQFLEGLCSCMTYEFISVTGTVHIYSISRHLMSLGHSARVGYSLTEFSKNI